MARKLKRKSKKEKGNTIIRENLLTMLRQCHLGGALEECILEIEEGGGIIKAIDITNTITVSIKGNISKEMDGELGLGNIDLIIKFLASMEDKKILIKVSSSKQHLELQSPNGKRRLRYLLTVPDMVVTKMETKKKNPFRALEKKMENEIKLNEKTIHDFLSYSAILKEKNTSLRLTDVKEKKRLSIIYGDLTEHQFEIVLDEDYQTGEDNGFDIVVNGEFIARIFNVIQYDEDNPPTLSFTNADMPILIKDKSAMWFVTPITEVPF